jgi:ABC-2 type transport system ATP-binding protein
MLNNMIGGFSMRVAVEAKNLVKDFGSVRALDKLNFKIEKGEIFGLIGLNGAGKTTALRITATLLLPTSGTVTVFGLDVVEEAAEIRKLITYLPEEAGAYKNLSGLEYLRFMANFRTKDKAVVEELVDAAAEISGLGDRLKDKVKTYSKGMKRRLLVARALMTQPKLAILDEPNSGLDVLHSVHVRTIIKRYAKEHDVTVLLSSHNMLDVEYLCDRVALISKGKVVAEGSPSELKEKYHAVNLEAVFGEVVGFA